MAYARTVDDLLEEWTGGLKLHEDYIVPVHRDTTLIRDIIREGSGDEYKFDYSKTFTKRNVTSLERHQFPLLSGIEHIYEVSNPFLWAAYLLKKQQKGGTATEIKVFHGTRTENVDSICAKNLNYRLIGRYGHLGNKYGNGVSFSPRIEYAKGFPRQVCGDRAMFSVKVIQTGLCTGRLGLSIPEKGCDTSISPDRNVLVKYSDNEFYPTHVAYYS